MNRSLFTVSDYVSTLETCRQQTLEADIEKGKVKFKYSVTNCGWHVRYFSPDR